MKKILFCAGLMAFVTSCTQDELFNEPVAEQARGIMFDAVVSDIAESRGTLYEDNKTYPFFWHAEKDKINVWAVGDLDGVNGVSSVSGNDWVLAANPAQYKATKSQGNGQFTSVDDANLMSWDDAFIASEEQPNPKAIFVSSYGATVTEVKMEEGAVASLIMTAAKSNLEQDYRTIKGANVADYAPMYSVSDGERNEEYHSVGESVKLKFLRPLAVARFKTEGLNDDYKTLFGNLKSISVETKGFVPGEGEENIVELENGSPIVYDAGADITVDMAAQDDPAETNVVTASSDNNKVTAKYNQAFGDDDVVFAALANVDRKAYKEEKVKETVEIKYEFENITFTRTILTDADWKSTENSVLGVPALKINDDKFFVVNATAGNTLIVNSGSFADVFTEDGKINWDGGIVLSDINRIDCHVALTSEEQAKLQGFVNLKELNLTAQTSLVKDALKGLTNLTSIKMPLVTTIDKDFATVTTFSALKSLELGSYPFNESKAINDQLVVSTLTYLDASAVTSMIPEYGKDDMLSFNGLTALEKIKVNNLTLNSNAFKNCTNLIEVIGTVNIENAEYAFSGCTSLAKVNISGTVIPKDAFSGCSSLVSVLNNGAQVVPTIVGENAFAGTSVFIMDLKNTTAIGAYAFSGSNLAYASVATDGTADDNIVVGAATVGDYAFSSTSVKRMNFVNATSLNPGIFHNVSALIQVKFDKAFTVETLKADVDPWEGTFGPTPENITLFVVNGQSYVSGVALKLPWINALNDAEQVSEFKFKQIMK